MPTCDDIVLSASYNAAMNARLYAAAATLPQDALRADRGAFFGSILGTLNHIVAGDTIWLRCFMGHPSNFPALKAMADIPAPAGLAHLYGDNRKQSGSLLLHFFNHQTHHRGQASTLLTQAGVDIGVTDLLEWIPGDS